MEPVWFIGLVQRMPQHRVLVKELGDTQQAFLRVAQEISPLAHMEQGSVRVQQGIAAVLIQGTRIRRHPADEGTQLFLQGGHASGAFLPERLFTQWQQ